MAYNTGNPSGSSDPRDMSDSSADIDTWATSTTADTHPDRLGTVRKTWRGMENEFDADQVSRASEYASDKVYRDTTYSDAQTDRAQRFDLFLANSGYQFVGDYAAGIELTEYNQVVRDASGNLWRVSASTLLPYTATGAGLPEVGAFIAIGDADLAQNLISDPSTGKGALLVRGSVIYVDSIVDLQALPTSELVDGQQVNVLSYHAPMFPSVKFDGGGVFAWDSSNTVDANNGTIFTADDTVTGRWVRQYSGDVNLKWFGAKGDGVTPDTMAIKSAVLYAVQHQEALYSPAGTYIVRPVTDGGPVYLNKGISADGMGLTMYGDGRGKTIFKEGDGETASGGRFTTMFYCWLADVSSRDYRYGSYSFKGMTFDKNGRSNVNSLPEGFNAYDWEGAHIIKFQGGGTITGDIDAVTFDEVELIDKIGAGIVLGPAATRVRSLVLNDIQSTDHPSIGGSGGPFGQKGCIEVAIDCDLTTYNSINCVYSQIEPTSAFNEDRKVDFKLSDSKIDIFEFTFLPGANDGQSNTFIEISNLTCKDKYLSRGCRVQMTNSRVKPLGELYDVTFMADNTVFLLPYSSTTEEVSPLYFNRPDAFSFQPWAELNNCEYRIDAVAVSESAEGYGLRSNIVSDRPFRVYVNGGKFDERLKGVCDTYSQGGDITLRGVKMAARAGGFAATGGSFSYFASKLQLIDCDFSAVEGDWLQVLPNNSLYSVKMSGEYDVSDFIFKASTPANVDPAQYPVKPKLYGSAPPASGPWPKGQRVYNTAPSAGDVEGWVCVAGGYPGTWKSFGSVEV